MNLNVQQVHALNIDLQNEPGKQDPDTRCIKITVVVLIVLFLVKIVWDLILTKKSTSKADENHYTRYENIQID